jgi:radical SAM protein with 4Fe4S-binding SPASM domain
MSNLASLVANAHASKAQERGEILCRREAWGGTIFHPLDATFVQLDHEAFDCVSQWLTTRVLPQESQARTLIDEVIKELPSTHLPARIVDLAIADSHASLNVLASPILVDFQITERCGMGCPQCYASSVVKGYDASWEHVTMAVSQMREAGVCQVALGGGEPVLHPRLGDMLELIRDNGMVPNITTTGVGMSDELMQSMKRNCGAVAMSLEGVHDRFAIRRKQGFANFIKVSEKFRQADIPLDDIVDFCLTIEPLYGVVFLAHKPAGRATSYDQPLAGLSHPSVHMKVRNAVKKLLAHTRVGFDCCFTPAVVGIERELGFATGTIIEGCSATRSGVGLTPRLDVVPCTFLADRPIGNLQEKSLIDIWRDSSAGKFRSAMVTHSKAHTSCQTCSANHACLGGCSVWSLVGCVTKEPLPA